MHTPPKATGNPTDLIPRYRIEANGPASVSVTDRLLGDVEELSERDMPEGAILPELVLAFLLRKRSTTVEIDPAGLGLPIIQELNAWGALTLYVRRADGQIQAGDRLIGVSERCTGPS